MAIPGKPLIRVQDFTAAYEGEVIIDHISFEVQRGEVLAILGGSGSGKSTLLKHLIGLYRPASGKILIEEDDITLAEGDDRLRILQKVGVT